ncbi:hypothetical protein BHYA_0107g00080 [Botrytis hyacinthi]|uniref:C2H2-type domain-containing protein n=1 Tax=Botrytis hyacinthi TaxID=278943 RepID=A0A4Z1GU52_9HELO|nr:hypothetical protein BHYA_0107g00080 [Botrytis hyacinthi]
MANPAPSFNCDKCFKTFTGKHNLDMHSRAVHRKLERCCLCHRVVKNLLQHHTRYHADVSEGRSQCQHCFRWYLRICAHKCSRLRQRSSYVPVACAPLRITEDPQASQASPSTVSTNRLASTPLLSPQHPTSRSVSLLPLNNTDSTGQISSSKISCNDAPSLSNLARLDFPMDMTVPLDPTKGPPELTSTYPCGINETISICSNLLLYNQGFASTSSPQGILNVDLPYSDIPVPGIESGNLDPPSAEEPTISETGFQWMTWEECMDCEFNALELWL